MLADGLRDFIERPSEKCEPPSPRSLTHIDPKLDPLRCAVVRRGRQSSASIEGGREGPCQMARQRQALRHAFCVRGARTEPLVKKYM